MTGIAGCLPSRYGRTVRALDRSTIGWLWVLGQVVISLLFVISPWSPHGVVAISIGIVLVLAGGVIGVSALRALGDALTPTPVPRERSTLRTRGIYSVVRHPIYTGLLTAMLGLLVTAGSAWTALWWVVAIAFFTAKSHWEDRLLHERYGTAWEEWARHTGALLPRRDRR